MRSNERVLEYMKAASSLSKWLCGLSKGLLKNKMDLLDYENERECQINHC
jgi:hypothetical protein